MGWKESGIQQQNNSQFLEKILVGEKIFRGNFLWKQKSQFGIDRFFLHSPTAAVSDRSPRLKKEMFNSRY